MALLHSIDTFTLQNGYTSLYMALLDSTLALHSTWFYFTLTRLYFTKLIDSTLTLPCIYCTMTLCHFTWFYFILSITLLDSTMALFHRTWLDLSHITMAFFYSTCFYITLTWLYITLFDSTIHYGIVWCTTVKNSHVEWCRATDSEVESFRLM